MFNQKWKILYWFLLLIATGILLNERLSFIREGQSAPIDIFIFLVFIAVLLVPVFNEISFFGLNFKQGLEEFKNQLQFQIQNQITSLRFDLQNTNNNSINLSFPKPPSDEQLPDLQERIRDVVSQALREQGITENTTAPPNNAPNLPEDNIFLFSVRFNIEKRLRNIALNRLEMDNRKFAPIFQITNALISAELLNKELGSVIREIYSICSPAIHGEEISPAKVRFVREVSGDIINTLDELEQRLIR
ncbi:hypothetical protein [Leptospira ilyithenensis]|uniref:Uncharacterized protein n=1 Tax=Leptospira ilyithenensis TaxID=2484901 RepID=A0A4R9LM93_9LEPT|nr:hypothetical protein [Leptospira ilyithenensis]TGN09661.1 hypothetical protein EHS11_11240 [Leptospira ilyithenensis]